MRAIGVCAAAQESLDIPELARELETSTGAIEMRLDQIHHSGLGIASDEIPVPMLLNAGRQYLAAGGAWGRDVLHFLPHTIDDLNAREALIHGGVVLVDELRHAIRGGNAVEHARELVPPAFSEAVDEALALELFAAMVALMARLSAGAPAGCVAEEIITVSLIEEARARIEMRADDEEISSEEAGTASEELRSIFELYEDDDVLDMFSMREPSDAAVAGHTAINRQLGVADQRVEAWFRPFGGTVPTGYLDEPRGST